MLFFTKDGHTGVSQNDQAKKVGNFNIKDLTIAFTIFYLIWETSEHSSAFSALAVVRSTMDKVDQMKEPYHLSYRPSEAPVIIICAELAGQLRARRPCEEE